jgi:hypothetical protein
VISLHSVWLFFRQPFDLETDRGSLTDVLLLMSMSLVWVFIIDLKRWAAMGYILLFIVAAMSHWLLPWWGLAGSSTTPLFPVDILFCFFILFWFKRFE